MSEEDWPERFSPHCSPRGAPCSPVGAQLEAEGPEGLKAVVVSPGYNEVLIRGFGADLLQMAQRETGLFAFSSAVYHHCLLPGE